MIINVRGCSNRSGIIISYLVENEEKTGYDSFNAKKIIVKNKIDMLAAIKKTLISSRKLSEINAGDFISTINKVGRKNVFDTSLKTIVKSVNDESMQSTMLTLSHVYFNNKPLPQIKAINIINGNMYFMVKVGPSYNLEPIKNERIKCVIIINSLVNLYRRIKQGGAPSKGHFKKHYISKSRPIPPRPVPSEILRNSYHYERTSNNGVEDSPAESIILEEGTIIPPRPVIEEVTPSVNGSNWYSSAFYPEGISTRRVTIEQAETLVERERTIESLYTDEAEERPADTENTVTEEPDTEEERPTERRAVVNGDTFTIIEPLPPESPDQDQGEERPTSRAEVEREMLVGIGIAASERRAAREAEVTVSVAEALSADEDEEDRQVLAERETEEERRVVTERRTSSGMPVSQTSAEAVVSATEAIITDESAVRRAARFVESPTQNITAGERYRRSFVEYLRENQTSAFDNLRENNDTGTSH